MKINRKTRIKALRRKVKRMTDYVERSIGKTDPDTFWRHYSGTYIEKYDTERYLWIALLHKLEMNLPIEEELLELHNHGVDNRED